MVSVEHLFSQLTVLDPTGELNVSELITQKLWPQEALRWHTQNGAACITLQNKKLYLVQQLSCWSKTTKALRCITEDLRCRMGPTDGRKQPLVLAANIIHPRCDSDIELWQATELKISSRLSIRLANLMQDALFKLLQPASSSCFICKFLCNPPPRQLPLFV